ncbi:MAG: Ig-like domain-containing protein [Reichenbachiella sp.]
MTRALLILLFCPLVLFAQEQPKVDQNHHTDENGKLYWYGNKPVYIFLSDNPEGKNMTRLNSQIHAQYTNPLYLDTEGINYFRTNWAADSTLKQITPKTEVKFEIYRDSKAPTTTVTLSGATKYKNTDGVQYYGKGLSLAVKTYDRHSGVQKTFYSVDNSNFVAIAQDQQFTADKEYDIKIYSADNTGNVEGIQMFKFYVDTISPVSEYTVHNDRSGMIFSPRTYLELKSNDVASGINRIFYKIDGGTERTYGSKVSLTSLAEGDHTVTYYATDNVKNIETEKVIAFYLDRTSPTVVATIVGDQFQNRGRVFISTRTKVKLTATDNKSGVKTIKYSIDGSEMEGYYEPFPLDKSKGNHVVTYFATDKVNNKIEGKLEESNLSRSSLDIDMDPPEISYKFNGPQYESRDTFFVTSKAKMALIAVDVESGIKDVGYKVNNGNGVVYTEPVSFDKEGNYFIDFYGTDQVNNRNTKSFVFVVDNTGPEIHIKVSMEPIGTIALDEKGGGTINVFSKGMKVYLSATDGTVDTDKIFYTFNDGAEVEYTKPIVLTQKGLMSYTLRAVDMLGNETITEPKEVFIK